VLYLLGIIVLWAVGKLTLTGVVAAFAVSLIAQTGYSAVVAIRLVGRQSRPDRSLIAPLYGYGAKAWLARMPELINVNVDQLVLSVLPAVAVAQLGNYTVAASLSWLALPASVAFGSVAFPRIARASDEREARRIERISLRGAAVIAGGTIGLVCVLAPFLVPKLFGAGYRDAIFALWLLAPGTVFLALDRVLGDLLQGRGQPLMRSIGQGLGAILTIVLLLILIPPFGIRGAAAASSVTYAAVFVFLMWALRHARRSQPLTAARP
jgi:O-antigen/teichoic acid export membrane protein